MKFGVIGSGDVGRTLADGLARHGHEVVIGSRTPAKLATLIEINPAINSGTFADAASFGEAIVLAVKGHACADALRLADVRNLSGKVVIDATNPSTGEPARNGVLKYFTEQNNSLMETLQKEFADVRFVKAFNAIGYALMVNPKLEGGPPTMFICGNDSDAKNVVTGILDQFGWETVDMGTAESAGALESLAILWCIPGFLHNEWRHAFKLLR